MALSLNNRALARAEDLAADAEALGAAVQVLSNGTRVIDCGIDVPGGLEAGRLFAEVCMGGLGTVSFTHLVFLKDLRITLNTDMQTQRLHRKETLATSLTPLNTSGMN